MYRNNYNCWVITDNELLALANYTIKSNSSLRKTSELTGISKSVLHRMFHTRIPSIDHETYIKLQKVLNTNFNTKHIRGGNVTKEKYKK